LTATGVRSEVVDTTALATGIGATFVNVLIALISLPTNFALTIPIDSAIATDAMMSGYAVFFICFITEFPCVSGWTNTLKRAGGVDAGGLVETGEVVAFVDVFVAIFALVSSITGALVRANCVLTVAMFAGRTPLG